MAGLEKRKGRGGAEVPGESREVGEPRDVGAFVGGTSEDPQFLARGNDTAGRMVDDGYSGGSRASRRPSAGAARRGRTTTHRVKGSDVGGVPPGRVIVHT